jgi:hypothetical protein
MKKREVFIEFIEVNNKTIKQLVVYADWKITLLYKVDRIDKDR